MRETFKEDLEAGKILENHILKTYNRVLGERKPPLKGKTKIIRIKDDTPK